MNRIFYILILMLLAYSYGNSQNDLRNDIDSIDFTGQLSALNHYNFSNSNTFYFNLRYIPELNYEIGLSKSRKIYFELSGNFYSNLTMDFDGLNELEMKAKPYRAWVRYSTNNFELRAGLQKINFGSAMILRPLMWFDKIDPRDPLQLTDGVYGVLGRYYFKNNANIWLWSLYGNGELRGWEFMKTDKKVPEYGGRIQLPLSTIGEIGLSFHHRKAYNDIFIQDENEFLENKVGFDFKIDYEIGFWFEGTWVHKQLENFPFKNQESMVLGSDYTFGIGNGLNVVFEHLVFSLDAKAFEFNDPVNFSAISLNYPIGLFDNASTIFYFDWKNKNVYSFINWQRTFDKTKLNIMAYWNPENYNFPIANNNIDILGGKGIIVLYTFNH